MWVVLIHKHYYNVHRLCTCMHKDNLRMQKIGAYMTCMKRYFYLHKTMCTSILKFWSSDYCQHPLWTAQKNLASLVTFPAFITNPHFCHLGIYSQPFWLQCSSPSFVSLAGLQVTHKLMPNHQHEGVLLDIVTWFP